MAGTREGGLQAAETNKRLYGKDFYERTGRKGGKISRGGAFTTNREFASAMGKIGGAKSRKRGRNQRTGS